MPNISVGFTGTRRGMTALQKLAVKNFLIELSPIEFHHGDCIGADAEANDIAGLLDIPVHLHPPDKSGHRAHRPAFLTHREAPYLVRNKRIVDACHVLLAAPGEAEEVRRSGTWSTIRYARKTGCKVEVILPE